MHSCLEAESRESPRGRERKIKGTGEEGETKEAEDEASDYGRCFML